ALDVHRDDAAARDDGRPGHTLGHVEAAVLEESALENVAGDASGTVGQVPLAGTPDGPHVFPAPLRALRVGPPREPGGIRSADDGEIESGERADGIGHVHDPAAY